jgi:ribonuclease T2
VNTKAIIRIVLTLAVAAVGAWQYQGGQAPSESSQKNHGNKNQHHKGQDHSANQTTGDFDYYLVSLSWSPAYCSTHPQDQTQCGGRGFGFVLHGLWPQKSAGGYPQDCPENSRPSKATVQKTLAFMPSEKLIQHEWTKHGTCTGLTADQYFELADRAYAAINIPASFQAPSSSVQMSAPQIVSAFLQANPSFSEDNMAIKCSKGELEEVRVCVDTQMKPKACGKGVRTQCGKGNSQDSVEVRSMR